MGNSLTPAKIYFYYNGHYYLNIKPDWTYPVSLDIANKHWLLFLMTTPHSSTLPIIYQQLVILCQVLLPTTHVMVWGISFYPHVAVPQMLCFESTRDNARTPFSLSTKCDKAARLNCSCCDLSPSFRPRPPCPATISPRTCS